MENHMDEAQRSSGNRRNGKSNKEISTSDGMIDIDTPRDCRSNFKPQLVEKRETILAESLKKKILGMYISEREGTNFGLSVLTDLQNRVAEDILIACIDNLKGFSETIQRVFPDTKVEIRVVHQIR